jgi:D-arginine dehydrogenase
LLDSDAADIDANGLHQGYLRQLRRHNGKMLTSKRVNVISRENDLWTVEAGGEQFSAPILINAAGAWADEVARMAGLLPIGMQPKRRTAVLVDPPAMADSRAWPLVIDIDEQFYFKPDAGQLLLSPADETDSDPCDAQPEELDIALAVERVMQAADITVRRIRHSWAGLRTFAEDRSPVVGFDPLMPGFFWLSGQGGYGLQTAPAMARVTAALACREAIPDSIAAFGVTEEALSPTRFRRTSPR